MEKTKTPAEDPDRGMLTATYLEEMDGDIFYKGYAEFKLDPTELKQRPLGDACGILAQSFNRVAPAEFRGPEPDSKDTLTIDYTVNYPRNDTATRLIETGITTFSQLLGYAAAEIEKPEYSGLKADDFFTGGLYKKILGAAWTAMQQGTKPETELDPEIKNILDSIALGQARTVVRSNNVASNGLLVPLLYTDEARGGKLYETFKYKKKSAETLVRVSLKDRKEITTSRPVSEYDDALQTAINSLTLERIDAGLDAWMTIDQICRQLKGDTHNGGVTDKEKADALDAIKRLSDENYLKVYINATEELRARGVIGPNEEWNFSGPCIVKVAQAERVAGGSKTTVFNFSPSILAKYSQLNGQKVSTSIDAWEIHEVDARGQITSVRLPDNKMRIQIKNYLWRRISQMELDERNAREKLRKYNYTYRKNQAKPEGERENLPKKTVKDFRDKKCKRVILFSTLYSALGIERNQARKRAKEYVISVLDYWIASRTMQLKSYEIRQRAKVEGKGTQTDAIAEIEFWMR